MGAMLQHMVPWLERAENHYRGKEIHQCRSVAAEFRARTTEVGACHGRGG